MKRAIVLTFATICAVLLAVDLYLAAGDRAQMIQRDRAASDTQPYGGCKEAARYPNTPGWRWCRDRGLLD